MTDTAPGRDLGCCGLDCGLCTHGQAGCVGCLQDGGDENCPQRLCCRKQDLPGCWACGRFPCDEGYFADPAWRGLAVGCCSVARSFGPEDLGRALAAWGPTLDYGHYRHLAAREVARRLLDGRKRHHLPGGH